MSNVDTNVIMAGFSFTSGISAFFKSALKKEIETAPAESLLWEVSGYGLKRPSYFFGTMHIMSAADAVLSRSVKQLIRQVKQIYLEVDMADMEQLLGGAYTINMKDDVTLADLLTGEDYEKVKNFFTQHQPHVDFAAIECTKPLMLSSSLYELFLPSGETNGIDIRIVEEARKYNKHIGGLESLAIQSSILDGIPYREQAIELVKIIEGMATYVATLQEMVKVYKQQDINRLHDLATKEEAGMGAHFDLIIYNRNKNWADQFPGIASKQSTLFAVGAGHLGGEDGVISILKKRGYKVRPLVNEVYNDE